MPTPVGKSSEQGAIGYVRLNDDNSVTVPRKRKDSASYCSILWTDTS